MATLGARIYIARSRKGYTQTELGDKIGAAQAQISQWENNKAEPTRKYMTRLKKVLGSLEDMTQLEDMAQEIRDLITRHPISVSDIANAAGVAVPTIYNIMNERSTPRKDTVMYVERALLDLREQYRDDAKDQTENNESKHLAFLGDAPIGNKIKSIRLFNPNDEKQVNALPDAPGVYMIYAGNNDIAFDLSSNMDKPIESDKLKMVGTPEYIGKADRLRERIKSHRYNYRRTGGEGRDWWWRDDWIDLAIYIEVDGDGKLHEELETLLIKLMSPQLNERKQGVKVTSKT